MRAGPIVRLADDCYSPRMSLPSAHDPHENAIHAVSRLCGALPQQAFDLLTTAQGMARWNLGLWHTQEVEPGLFSGHSLFGGGRGWVRVRSDRAAGRVEYLVGSEPRRLVARIEARVHDSVDLGHPPGGCLVSLMAWRTADMEEDRWRRLITTHETEIELIRSLLDGRAFDALPGPRSDAPRR